MSKRVLIVGAGPSGLPAAKWALEYGITPVVFEATDSVGGLWNFKEEETEWSTVMKFTVNNTSKELTAYSDFVPHEKEPPYMGWRQLLNYFRDYANHFGLISHIRFNHRVINIERAEDYSRTGRWKVHFREGNGEEQTELFDYVVLATGHHCTPNFPEQYKGQDLFKGEIIHSHSYKSNKGFADKTVVVVGMGNSGCDVAVDTSRVANQVYLSTRRGGYVLNKVSLFGLPADAFLNRRVVSWVRQWLPSLYSSMAEAYTNFVFDHDAYGLQPKHRITQQQPASSDELYGRLIGGSVKVKGAIREFTEHGVVFEEGQHVDDVDYVVLGTGYRFDFNLIEHGHLIPVENNIVKEGFKLWKRIFPIHLHPHNTLGMIGFFQPVGSVMPIAEMQARVFFEVVTGQVKLPEPKIMTKDINEVDRVMFERYYQTTRHTIQVDFTEYMTELGDLIGCTPDLVGLLFKDPKLALQVALGMDVAYNYRLNGPNPWTGAREAVMGATGRLRTGVHHRDTPNKEGSSFGWFFILLPILVLLYVLLC